MIFLVPCAAALLLATLSAVLNAPVGHENQDGFHYGEPSLEKFKRQELA